MFSLAGVERSEASQFFIGGSRPAMKGASVGINHLLHAIPIHTDALRGGPLDRGAGACDEDMRIPSGRTELHPEQLQFCMGMNW